MTAHGRLSAALGGPEPAVVPYLTGGYPDTESFMRSLDGLSAVSPAIEVGIPFSDPMADGATIQESSRVALAAGATVEGVVAALERRRDPSVPLVIMSYLNPLLAFGVERLMRRLAGAGVCSLVIPDLPLEELGLIGEAAEAEGLGVAQMVTPLTDPGRLGRLCAASRGFVYAVTMTGTTGGDLERSDRVAVYLDRVRAESEVPVLAGFGVRTRDQFRALAPHCDGVIVGSAIVERIASGGNPVELVEELIS